MKEIKKLRLTDCHLYAIASPADLARRLGTSAAELERLASSDSNFRVWTNGAGREIQQPIPELQRLHARVHRYLARVDPPDFLHSPVKRRSYVTNAAAHIGSEPSVKVDIRRFFRSVPRAAVYRFFLLDMKCAGDAAGLLSKLLTFGDHLATGSSASPIIAYFAFRRMFDEIADFARDRALIMTCYVDDLTITGPQNCGNTVKELRMIVRRYGLASHKIKMFPKGRSKIVTGVVVGGDSVKLPNKRHKAIADGFEALEATSTAAERVAVLDRLISRLHEAGMIEPVFKARAITLQAERLKARAEAAARQPLAPGPT